MEGLKSKDLRRGNYIQEGVEIVKIDVIYPFFCKGEVVNKKGIFDYSIPQFINTKGILLDDCIILNFGFEKKGLKYNKCDFSFYRSSLYSQLNISVFHFGQKKKVNIYYVHQLQNLYFALTGEELIMKDELK